MTSSTQDWSEILSHSFSLFGIIFIRQTTTVTDREYHVSLLFLQFSISSNAHVAFWKMNLANKYVTNKLLSTVSCMLSDFWQCIFSMYLNNNRSNSVWKLLKIWNNATGFIFYLSSCQLPGSYMHPVHVHVNHTG